MTWIQNVEWRQGALGGAEDIGEGEPALVPIPRTYRWSSKGGSVSTLSAPDDERRVNESDEWRHALDRGALASGGIGEAERLLQLAEADLDIPAAGIAQKHLLDAERGVGGKVDADLGFRLDDHNPQS